MTRRSKAKYPSLKKKFNSRIKQEKIDFDYLDQLSPSELDWLAKFMEEENSASFKNDGTDLNTSKEDRKKIYDRNNAANRCLHGNLKNKADRYNNKKLLSYEVLVNATDTSKSLENELSKDINPNSMEDAYIDFLESKQIEAMIEEYDMAMEQFSEISGTLEVLQQETPQSQEPSIRPPKNDL